MFKPSFLIVNVYHISRNLNYRFYSLQNEQNVRVRFAPSPTGELHLGSLRTALFNYLYARKYDGKFILRLEDTDRDRLVQGVDKKIEQTLEYFGLKLDESPEIGGEFGPYRQSERLSLYKNAANKLIESGHAYKCFCTPERLNILRVKCLNEKIKPKYDLFCRNLSISEIESRENEGKKSVIRFKFEPGEKKFKDTVFGNDYKCYLDEADFVIMKADGFPTYHFANVVDDHHMQITDVIRGSEWLMSTPKHMEIYSAFNWKSPKFIHLPLLTQDGHKKLSKRNTAAFVDYYTRLGYLPDAVLNFLLRNGSGITNHKKNKLYTLQELVDNFDENLIGKNSFMMDMKELDRYGRMAFREASFNDLLPIIKYQFSLLDEEIKHSINEELLQENYFKKVVSFLQSNEEAFSKIFDITSGSFRFFFMMPKSAKKLMESFPNVSQTIDLMKEFIIYLRADKFTYDDLKILAKEKHISAPNLSKLIRLSLLDNVSGPPIRELVEFFGKERIEQRLNWMINRINDDAIEETKRSVA